MLVVGTLTMMTHCRHHLIGRPKLVVFPIGLMHRAVLILEKHMEIRWTHLKSFQDVFLTSHSGISLDDHHFYCGMKSSGCFI